MQKSWPIVVAVLAVVAGLLLWHGFSTPSLPEGPTGDEGYKNGTYRIDGRPVQLANGVAQRPAAPGSASKVVTRYFGNELKADLNEDGREDVVFLLTQDTGGSGVFYYVVAALNTPQGWMGSDGYFLGDRIAPQSSNMSQDPQQPNVIVINYADRVSGQPMTEQPTIGKSVYLKLDVSRMHLGPIPPDELGSTN